MEKAAGSQGQNARKRIPKDNQEIISTIGRKEILLSALGRKLYTSST
jgi:hypothetical protein